MAARPASRRADAFAGLVILGGGLALYYLRPELDPTHWLPVLGYALLTFVSEALPVELPGGRGTVSVSFAIIYAAMVVLGPGVATWLAAFATIRTVELKGNVRPLPVLFNRAQLALSAGAAGLVYVALGGVPGHIEVIANAPALLAAALAYPVVNITLIVAIMALTQKSRFLTVWLRDIKWTVPHYLALTPLGVLIGITHTTLGIGGVLLVFIPLAIARYSMKLYVEMKEAHIATIQAMVAAIEARDQYTAGHSIRVAKYATALARRIRLSEEKTERLEYAASLHDLGKLAIPDRVLQKSGPLTGADWRLMQDHPRTGADILAQAKILGEDVEVVLHHHERWDGTGYPDGLKGSEIPLEARIIALADAFEAMTSARPYRAPMTPSEALAEIGAAAGSQLDPDLIEPFAQVVAELQDEMETFVTARLEAATARDSETERDRVAEDPARGRYAAPEAGPPEEEG